MAGFPKKCGSSYDDNESLNSIGIDIGSTTTQLVFSELTMGFVEEKHKYDIIKRDITHQSKIFFTPFNNDFTIDVEGLSEIIKAEYKEAGLSTVDIQTGAVIITGVAALRHNAKSIVNLFADQTGKFVCAVAGPNYEAILAAYGSGAVELSKFELKTVLNVDVGGGTSKITVIRNGEVVDTASLFVGARHVSLDCDGRVIKIEEPAKVVANSINVKLVPDRIIPLKEQRMLAASLVEALFEVIENRGLSPLTEKLLQTQPLKFNGKTDIIVFSGGVSEYIYKYESKNYGDLGILLGEEIRKRICHLDAIVAEPTERIRATVIGESQYTVQISGTTNLISSLELLPLKNLPVVAPNFDSSVLDQQAMEKEMIRAIELHDIDPRKDTFALAFRRSVINQPLYVQMKLLSNAIISIQREKITEGTTTILVFEADIGMGIGRVIQEEIAPGGNLISIDEIKLGDFNFIDIGEPTGARGLIPVIIKSLVFPNQKLIHTTQKL